MVTTQRISPCLWFNDDAEIAAKFYTDVFVNSRIVRITRYPDAGRETHGHRAGSVMTVSFELDGVPFTALNGGPEFPFTEAISMQVHCKDQAEIDYFWEKLRDGGEESVCGWLKDRFGMSWQVVPAMMDELFSDENPSAAERTMEAMLKMKKLDIAELQRAHDNAEMAAAR
jgi:predicted 3-demethylubiquinone-9 3-methyltransferase (glyoxalase superfamily)